MLQASPRGMPADRADQATAMSDDDAPRPPHPAGDFDARLRKAQETYRPAAQESGGRQAQAGRGSALGSAFRLGTELVAAVLVGGGIGWALDYVLGTGPWLLLVFFMLGVVAGLINVTREARAMNLRALQGASENTDEGRQGEK